MSTPASDPDPTPAQDSAEDAALEDPTPGVERPTWVDRVQRVRFFEMFDKYRQQMVHRDTGLPFEPRRDGAAPLTIERLAFETGWGLDLALKVFFPLCFLAFLISFRYDLESHLLRTCAVAGMIGFGTNWVAIKMLFWPREPRPVFGQGLIPSQRDQLVEKVADEVLEKLINEELISQKVEESRVVKRFTEGLIEGLRDVTRQEEFRRDLRNMILTYVGELAADPKFRARVADKAERSLEEFGGSGFKRWMVKKLKRTWRTPLLSVINKELEELEETLDGGLGEMDGVLEALPRALEHRQETIDRVLTKMLMGIVREVDIREIVLEQLSTVTPQQLEEGFREFSDDKLSFITLLGGILGVVGGTVVVWPVASILVMLGLFGLMALVDVAVHPLMKSRYWPTAHELHELAGHASGSGRHAAQGEPEPERDEQPQEQAGT